MDNVSSQIAPATASWPLPTDGLIVETNLGMAICRAGIWFKWWSDMGRASDCGIKDPITWWKSEDGVLHKKSGCIVKIGQRKYGGGTWRRKDKIFADGTLIGVIELGEYHRPGMTVCLVNSTQATGWQPQWCYDQHMEVAGQTA
jgi:hypothetical protein